ncbi:Uma2 family endonuclease [Nonomuraea harbinensis]|uniref:Uma2 family endonuclease n=1 Tax=Nonomuraea harbinensis TaxID=1286938 RepID=A0ABW1C771_9ACTN
MSATTGEVPPAPAGEKELTTLRDVYDALVGRTKMRAEIIDGRLIVSPLGTPEHQVMIGKLVLALGARASERGWVIVPGLSICMDGSRDPYEPDFALYPPDAPRWGAREVYASGLIMVAETVSASSTHDDREHKPGIYATARIPIYLLIDPIAEPAQVTVFSEPKDGRYTISTSVDLGKEIHLPDPVDFLLDTAVFL